MTEIIRDTCLGQVVRSVRDEESGARYFFAADLAAAAGYTSPGHVFGGLQDFRVGKQKDPETGRTYRTVNQTAVVACLAKSPKPEAKLVLEWLEDFFFSTPTTPTTGENIP